MEAATAEQTRADETEHAAPAPEQEPKQSKKGKALKAKEVDDGDVVETPAAEQEAKQSKKGKGAKAKEAVDGEGDEAKTPGAKKKEKTPDFTDEEVIAAFHGVYQGG